MQRIPFVKYTSCGNSFVIVDELDVELLSEGERAALAWQAVNPYFGVGCDNLIVLQRCTEQSLAAINRLRGYWTTVPDAGVADVLFRMFEPNGDEAFCCGNGLACVAHYLRARHGMETARILTEIPLPAPRPLTVGAEPGDGTGWVRLPAPRPTPGSLVDRSRLLQTNGLERLEGVVVKLRAHDLEPLSDSTVLSVSGAMVFTGEPHLVVFPERDLSLMEVSGAMFSSTVPHHTDTSGVCQRVNFGTTLLRRIGYHLNRRQRELFPAGISVNVVRVDEEAGAIEYRTYERGIEHETLACGTGALAAVYATRQLGYLVRDSYEVWPHRCRWYDTEARLRVRRESDEAWVLESTPRMLFEGMLARGPGEVSAHEPDGELARSIAEVRPAEQDEAESAELEATGT